MMPDVTCVLCRNGRLVPGTGDKALSHAGTMLVVQGVPAEVCDNCGERYFDEDVTRRLLQLACEAAAAGVVVQVCRYVTG